ncbi:MAG TPA: PqqD family protein [Candidatus Bathyarchaeia archaeon]|nr:PqqD family protein [Candidatus Bathyarchaeia archaeon]
MSRAGHNVRAAEGVLVKEMDGEAVLLDLASETYFGLDRTAFRIWTALTSRPTVEAALEDLAREYEVEGPALAADVLALLDTLERKGLVRVGHA